MCWNVFKCPNSLQYRTYQSFAVVGEFEGNMSGRERDLGYMYKRNAPARSAPPSLPSFTISLSLSLYNVRASKHNCP